MKINATFFALYAHTHELARAGGDFTVNVLPAYIIEGKLTIFCYYLKL